MGDSKEVTFKEPTNFRAADCCGNCKQWEWEYEGEGHCKRYPSYVSGEGEHYHIWDGAHAVGICDDFEAGEDD